MYNKVHTLMYVLCVCVQVESQEEVIGELASQLRASRDKSSTLEKEFTEYRAHTQVR